jgi:CheY-like chemotaxis protein
MIYKTTIFLVVDDFEPMRKVTAEQLRALGAHSVILASNGAEAMYILQNRRIDFILSDWNMPIMTGMEFLKAVRADAKLTHLPFIMITAEAERRRILEVIANGVTDLLVKPYTAYLLGAHIERVTAHSRSLSLPVPTSQATTAVAAIAPRKAQSITQATQEPVRPTLLVVDDTPDNLLLLSQLFKDEYRVRIAHSGEKALDICRSDDPPDLVLLDIMMPGLDGFEVAQRMREHPTSETIPIIFVTAMTDEESRLKGLALGAVDFVTKPIDPAVLKPRVRNFMRFVELHKKLQSNYDQMLQQSRLREDVENISRHDLKGPLASVVSLLQVLEKEPSIGRAQSDKLHMAEQSAMQVLDMINLSSVLFKIETDNFALDARPVLIEEVLRRIAESARVTFAEKHISLRFNIEELPNAVVAKALGDVMFCYSIFQNLIKNACEAAPEKSRVSITLKNESPLQVIITNTGTVPAQIRQHFFDKYVTYGKQGGSGLGTYSAKLLTEAQHGSVGLTVDDLADITTITVTLPRHVEKTR